MSKLVNRDVLKERLSTAETAHAHFAKMVETHAGRFVGGATCLARYVTAVESLQATGEIRALAAVDEQHNELSMAEELLRQTSPALTRVDYEPAIAGTNERIDFRVINNDRASYVEVKTIHPEHTDRWDHYERTVDDGRITERVDVHFEKQWMGGVLWHNTFAARSKMFEYAEQFERRIEHAGITGSDCVLALFSNGFDWPIEELEDFVAYYTTGQHRPDDPFAAMEQHDIATTGRTLTSRISSFGYFFRRSFDVSIAGRCWPVRPPAMP